VVEVKTDFPVWVEAQAGGLHNDDVTLVHMDVW